MKIFSFAISTISRTASSHKPAYLRMIVFSTGNAEIGVWWYLLEDSVVKTIVVLTFSTYTKYIALFWH
jgi:hypothetical protein